ncbi:MAG: C39 family peptidase [Candidatus Doudnabacteria bacterium]|nr:C39 family peptidase [Candidatus Doudnabacteria bacterium]
MDIKKLLSIGIVLILAAAAYIFLRPANNLPANNLLGKNIAIYAYTVAGKSNGGASVAVPFTIDAKDSGLLNAALDFNHDGKVAAEEWVVQNIRPRVQKDGRNLLHFTLPEGIALGDDKIAVFVALGKEPLTNWDGTKTGASYRQTRAKISPVELGDVLGLNVPGAGPDVYRGSNGSFLKEFAGISTALADPIDVQSDLEIPDYPQGNMECGPTSAANNLTGLAGANGAGDRLPTNPREIIDELKTDMNFNNGVIGADNFVNGKNAFTSRHQLPITTTVIERPSVQDIASAIQNGCAVEMDLAFVEAVNGRAGRHVASHTVTVTGVYSDGADKAIYGADSATPDGVEIWRFSDRGPNLQLGYPLWDGATVVMRIFVQCWTPPAQPDESRTAPPEEPEDQAGSGKAVEMLVINGVYYPKYQFRVANPDACGQPHYHAATAYGLSGRDSLEVVSAPDPNPSGCGFGAVAEVPVETITISHEQSLELVKYLW